MSTQEELQPRESRGTLEPVLNTIAVYNGLLYDYYPIRMGNQVGCFVELTKLLPLIVEGFVTYKGELYPITKKDYIRRRLNVTRPIARTTSTSPTNSISQSDSESTTSTSLDEKHVDSIKFRADYPTDDAIDKAADLAWKEQIDTLQYLDDSEEER